jgi:hypothetical protein
MEKKVFDSGKSDTQATKVDPIKISDFNIEAYQDYTQKLNERCQKYMQVSSGVLVYRRMRVAEVFSYGCREMKQSLEWQLGALQKSMAYEADVPNFLEPWYGLGIVGTAFGLEYIWNPGQSPAVKPAFETIDEALAYNFKQVKDTPEGKHSLQMIEYFLDQTKGKIPMSMGDIQSPFNNATSIVDSSNFLISIIMEPEKVLQFLDLLADLMIDFYKEQEKMIGSALVKPGHGFTSSHVFEGFAMSDDNLVMVDSGSYYNYMRPAFEKVGKAFGGPVLHSCGNYTDKIEMIKRIGGLKMIDAAFSIETDPAPNPATPFADGFINTGIVLNARIVGDTNVVENTIRELWKPGMKLLAVTYSQSPEEQYETYQIIQNICNLI